MESTTASHGSPPGSGISATLSPTARPWSHLSLDLLLDISSRLDDATDFTRFHAVCTPWRDVLSRATIHPAFSPWLLALCNGKIIRSTFDFGCVSSFDSFEEASEARGRGNVLLPEPPCTDSTDRNWVASADGTAAWLFVATPQPSLLHLLTGSITPLPDFPDDDEIRVPMENPRGIVYGDGTVFLYRFLYEESMPKFTAAILGPDATSWTVMKRILEVPTGPFSDLGAVYHDGQVLVCVGDFWSVLTQGDFGGHAGLQSRYSTSEQSKYSRECHYVLESQGELLWASVILENNWYRSGVDIRSTMSVKVHALEKGAGGVMRWAVRDGWSLADRILFLGSTASFAVDAHKLGMSGGCVYFVSGTWVYRHGLVVGETELVRQLPLGCSTHGGRLWIWRQPTIAPIQDIREGFGLHPNKKQKLSN